MWKTHSSTTRAWEPGRRFVTQFDEPKKKSRTMKGSRSLLLVVYIYMLIYLYSLFDSILIECSPLGRNIWIQANSTTKKNDAQMAFLEDQHTFHVPAIDAGYNFKKYITSEMGACYRSNTKTKSLLKWWEKKAIYLIVHFYWGINVYSNVIMQFRFALRINLFGVNII